MLVSLSPKLSKVTGNYRNRDACPLLDELQHSKILLRDKYDNKRKTSMFNYSKK